MKKTFNRDMFDAENWGAMPPAEDKSLTIFAVLAVKILLALALLEVAYLALTFTLYV